MATVFPLFIADAEGASAGRAPARPGKPLIADSPDGGGASADRPPAGTENPRRSGDFPCRRGQKRIYD